MDKTEAILIGRLRHTESTLIVRWCSPQEGLFSTIAKGALRPKSTFNGQLDLFVGVDLSFVRSRRSEIHTLTEVRWLAPRLGLRGSYGRVLAATYLVKLIELVVEPHAPIPGTYELLMKALDYLADHDPTLKLIERFEGRLAEELGIGHSSGGAIAIEQAFHRRLPVQRQQVLAWIRGRSEGN
jgi:DNA repair protein RecO